jgi:DNA-directed RNA polymerase subunit RPC12/RpoP
MKDFKIKIIILIVLLVIGILVSEWASYESANEWNDGTCSNCGGSWEYQQTITRGKYSEVTHYMYKCDTCGRIVELTNYYY